VKPPKPETLRAILPSFGSGPGRPTWTEHKYVETRECMLPSPDGAAWEFIFVCEVTKVERRWGTADRVEPN
jgi:hypothetical protein